MAVDEAAGWDAFHAQIEEVVISALLVDEDECEIDSLTFEND